MTGRAPAYINPGLWRRVGHAAGLLMLLAASPRLLAQPDAQPQGPTVLVVVGAEGEEQYGKQFRQWAERWSQACGKAGAQYVAIGLDAETGTMDRDRLREQLEHAGKERDTPLWVVLIGHGTFDGRTAKFNLRGPDVTAAELAQWLAPIRRPLAVVNTASSSAPFIAALSAPGRVVIAATKSADEVNFARFGDYLSQTVIDPAADLDRDGQTSLLEAYLAAARLTQAFYDQEGRLATEHALLDDNGDGLGTRGDWFRGIHATRKPDKGQTLDGHRAHQFHLLPGEFEKRMTADQRRQRDELELNIERLREAKATIDEADYYARLERLMLELARLYATVEDGDDAKKGHAR